MRQKVSLLLVLLMLASFPPAARAEAEALIVERVRLLPEFSQTNFYEAGGFWCWALGADDLPLRRELELPQSITCVLEDGREETFPILWDTTAERFAPELGFQTLGGKIQLPPGYAFANPVQEDVSFPVLPVGEEYPAYTGAVSDEMIPQGTALLLPLGGDAGTLLTEGWLPAMGLVYLDDMPTFDCPMDWRLDTLDTTQQGTVQLVGQPLLPSNLSLAPDYVPPTCSVTISRSDFIRLDFYGGKDRMGNPIFRWLWAAPDLAKMQLFYSTDGGVTWVEDTAEEQEGDALFSRSGAFVYGKDFVSLLLPYAQPKTTYTIYFTYGDESSNLLELTTGELGFSYNVGGDRDGSMTPPEEFPPLEQPGPDEEEDTAPESGRDPLPQPEPEPTPEPEPEPTPAPELVPEPEPVPEPQPESVPELVPQPEPEPDPVPKVEALPNQAAKPAAKPPAPSGGQGETSPGQTAPPAVEQVTGTQSRYTGVRLRRMLALGDGTLLFEGEGGSVELSADFLRQLELADEAFLEVTMEKPEENAFRLRIVADGVELVTLPDTLVRVPLASGEGLACYDADGNLVSQAQWDSKSKTLACTIQATGLFYLRATEAAQPAEHTEAPEPTPPAEPAIPWGWVGGAGVCALAAGGWCIWRRWRHE